MNDAPTMTNEGTPSEGPLDLDNAVGDFFNDAPDGVGEAADRGQAPSAPVERPEAPAQPEALAPIEDDDDPLAPPKDLPGTEPVAAPEIEPEPVEEPIPEAIQRQPKEARDAFAKARKETQEQKRAKREIQLQLDQAQTRYKAIEAELNTLKTQAPKELSQVAEMQKKIEEMQERLGRHDITATEAFKADYDTPLQRAFQLGARSLGSGTGRTPQDAQKIMQKLVNPNVTPEEINGILSDEPTHVQAAVFLQIQEFNEAKEKREAAIKDWKSKSASYKDKETRNLDARSATEVVSATDAAAVQLLKEGNPLLMKSPTDQKWNAAVDNRLRIVQGILRDPKMGDLAKYVADGVTSREFREAAKALKAENAKLKRELSEVRGFTPRVQPAVNANRQPEPQGRPAGGMDIESWTENMDRDAPAEIRR